jgi:hypothetical protein
MKKTDPPPLHKEDKASKEDATSSDFASLDRSSLSLSPSGLEVAADLLDPRYLESVLLLEYAYSITKEERSNIRRRIQDANPRASEEELKVIHRDDMLKSALEARKGRGFRMQRMPRSPSPHLQVALAKKTILWMQAARMLLSLC